MTDLKSLHTVQGLDGYKYYFELLALFPTRCPEHKMKTFIPHPPLAGESPLPDGLDDEVHKPNEGSCEEEVFCGIRVGLCKVDSRQSHHLGDPMLTQELHLCYQTHLTNQSLVPHQHLYT